MRDDAATAVTFPAARDLGETGVKQVIEDAIGADGQPLAGRRLVDIGCGSGALVRWLRKLEIAAVGVEPEASQLVEALAGPRSAPRGCWLAGRAERLPIAERSCDVALFFNSLHHVPAGRQVAALVEAARVLRRGGSLLVIEPVAAGSFFELLAPLDDETAVRAAAQRALQAVAGRLLRPVAAARFTTVVRFADPQAVIASFTGADPGRAALAAAVAPTIAQRFATLGESAAEGGRRFRQPMTLHHFERE
jgi:ubiquinone/menaquinone biosynthesis C-methylase UbiE